MATLTSGNSASFTLLANQTLIISSAVDSSISLTEPGKKGTTNRTVHNETIQFGPFTVNKQLVLRCNSGTVEHDLQTFSQVAASIIYSESDPVDNDGRPDGTLWLKVSQ